MMNGRLDTLDVLRAENEVVVAGRIAFRQWLSEYGSHFVCSHIVHDRVAGAAKVACDLDKLKWGLQFDGRRRRPR